MLLRILLYGESLLINYKDPGQGCKPFLSKIQERIATNKMINHICHISTIHSEESVRIFYKECKTILSNGYQVSYIVQSKNDRIVDGIRIAALGKPKSRKDRMFKLGYQAYRKALDLNADVYHFHDPELIPFALLLKLRGMKVVYDVHEDITLQVMSKNWIAPYLRRPASLGISIMEAIAARCFDAIVAATPSIKARFPANKTYLVQNYPIIDEFASSKGDYQRRKPIVSYIGGISVLRGAKEMAKAITKITESIGSELHLAGHIQPEILSDELIMIAGKRRLVMHGWVSRGMVSNVLNASRVGLVVLHPLENYLESYPVKLFEYMAAAIPVVASNFPLWKDIIEASGCGLVVDPLSPGNIAEAIQWLLEHPKEAEQMGQRGKISVQNIYNWDNEAKKLISMYEYISS